MHRYSGTSDLLRQKHVVSPAVAYDFFFSLHYFPKQKFFAVIFTYKNYNHKVLFSEKLRKSEIKSLQTVAS